MGRRTSVLRSDAHLPPGTVTIEDITGTKIVLSPQPTSDPNQPLNWSTWRKTIHMIILCFYGLMIYAVLCMNPPLWEQQNEELGFSFEDLSNSYATGQGTMAVGCVLFVPFALKFGRRPVYIVTALITLAACIWQAKTVTRGDLYGGSALVGIAGAVNEILFQLTVADLFFVHQRATMNAVFLGMVLFGNYLGPVAGGFIADAQGWRWAWWYCTIFMSISCVTVIFGLEESKYVPETPRAIEPVSKMSELTPTEKEKEADLNVEPSPSGSDIAVSLSSNSKFLRQVEIDTSIPMNSLAKRFAFYTVDHKHSGLKEFLRHAWQPFAILFQFPIVAFAALNWGWMIGILVILSVIQADLYPEEPYNFSASAVGLQNLPPAIGCAIGCILGGPLNDLFILKVAKRRKGIYEPETRLSLYMIPGFCMTIGVLMFGLTIAQGKPWIINAIGAGFIGVSLGANGDMALTYVQDSYTDILGDALVGVMFVRNALATILTFAVPPWLNMGVYNMFVVIGVLSTVVMLTSVPMYIWGRQSRVRLAKKYDYYIERQY